MATHEHAENAKQPSKKQQSPPSATDDRSAQAAPEQCGSAGAPVVAVPPSGLNPSRVLLLQRTVGNRAVQRALARARQAVVAAGPATPGAMTAIGIHPGSPQVAPAVQRYQAYFSGPEEFNLRQSAALLADTLEVRSIQYSIEFDSGETDREPDMYVLYVHHVSFRDPQATIPTVLRLPYGDFLDEVQREDEREVRESFVLRNVGRRIFRNDVNVDSLDIDALFERRLTSQGAIAYRIRNHNHLNDRILTELQAETPALRAGRERMPGGVTPEQWREVPRSQEDQGRRRGQAEAWLPSAEGVGAGYAIVHRGTTSSDWNSRLVDRAVNWIRPLRQMIQGGTPTRVPRQATQLFRLHQSGETNEDTIAAEVRTALGFRGPSGRELDALWQMIRDALDARSTSGLRPGEAVERIDPALVRRICGRAIEIRAGQGRPNPRLDSQARELLGLADRDPGQEARRLALQRIFNLPGPPDRALFNLWQALIGGSEPNTDVAKRVRNLMVGASAPRGIDNPHAIEVNFYEAAHGPDLQFTGASSPSEASRRATVDPQFAVTMIQFLRALADRGVTMLYHAGFVRDPMSPADTHPLGMAVDITGFRVGNIRLDLRHADPRRTSEEEHSDWFDTRNYMPDGRTHRQALVEFAGIMERFFNRIVGPGREAHFDHFHCEISASPITPTGRSGPISAPATPLSPEQR